MRKIIEREGVTLVYGDNSKRLAVITKDGQKSVTTVFDASEQFSFLIKECKVGSGGKLITAVGTDGYETQHYEP